MSLAASRRLAFVLTLAVAAFACDDDSESVVPCTPAPVGMTCIEGGSFMNGPGSNFSYLNEQFERDVATYWLDITEVTVAAYAACVNAGGCTPPDSRIEGGMYCNWDASGRENHPVNCVDAFQAENYCTWAGKRLPTEWEWEWAARGRDAGLTYPWGEGSPTCALAVMYDTNLSDNPGCGAFTTAPVGNKPVGASRDGVLDLAGNVWEWTFSIDGSQSARVLRGGGWINSLAVDLRADVRVADAPSSRGVDLGFRCAMTP